MYKLLRRYVNIDAIYIYRERAEILMIHRGKFSAPLLSSLSAHFGVVQDLVFFDEEALGLMAPLNMDPKVSANRPSHQPQPPPLLTPAFIACAYVVPSGRLWHSIFSRAKYYI